MKQYNERIMEEEEMARKKMEEEEMLRQQQQDSGKQQQEPVLINVTPSQEKQLENTSQTDLQKQYLQEQEQLQELVQKQMEENTKLLEQKKAELESEHVQKLKELEEKQKNLQTKEDNLDEERKDYLQKMQVLDKEIMNLRSNIHQSQNGLIQELGKLKNEAINQHEERYRNKRHIDNIIEQLRQAEVNDLMREQNLLEAIRETKAFDQPQYTFSKDYEKIIDEKNQQYVGKATVPSNSKLISLNQKIRNDIYTDATSYQQRQLLPYLDKEYAYSNNLTKAIQLDTNQFPSLQNENERTKMYNSYQNGLLPIERDERKVHAGRLAKINDERLYELNKLDKDQNQFNVIGKLDDIVYSVQS